MAAPRNAKEPPSLVMKNFYGKGTLKQKYRNPNPMCPQHPFRALVVGASGAGKTNLCLNLIDKCRCFDRVYVFAKTPDEELWQQLAEKNPEKVTVSGNLDELPLIDPESCELDGEEQVLVIFDDYVNGTRDEIAEIRKYFVWSRKHNVSCIFISQSYYAIDKVIRLNANYIFVRKVNSTFTMRAILQDFPFDVDPKKLKEAYKDADAHGAFLMIDIDTQDSSLRFRRGLGIKYCLGDD